jgi:hypothetical protein
VAGGEPTLLLRDAATPIYFPDGNRIAFVDPSSTQFHGSSISIANTEGPPSRRTLVKAKDSIWWPTMSPDGTGIAFQDLGSIYVVDVSSGESSVVAYAENAEWLDADTLIVTP